MFCWSVYIHPTIFFCVLFVFFNTIWNENSLNWTICLLVSLWCLFSTYLMNLWVDLKSIMYASHVECIHCFGLHLMFEFIGCLCSTLHVGVLVYFTMHVWTFDFTMYIKTLYSTIHVCVPKPHLWGLWIAHFSV